MKILVFMKIKMYMILLIHYQTCIINIKIIKILLMYYIIYKKR